MESGKIIKWLKKEGDRVQSGDILAEVETDKADVEMEAFGSGVLRKILQPAGSTVPVGSLIGVIAEPDEDIAAVAGQAGAPAAPAASAAPALRPPRPRLRCRAVPPRSRHSPAARIPPRARRHRRAHRPRRRERRRPPRLRRPPCAPPPPRARRPVTAAG